MNQSHSVLLHPLLIAALLFSGQPAVAGDQQQAQQVARRPSAEAMILDGLVYRPVSLAGSIVGTGIFVVTLPFSLLGGNVKQAGETLVLEPARDTFGRCLGCIDLYGRDRDTW